MSSIRDFVPLSKIGEGTFSTVYKVRRISDEKIYALKKARMKNLSQKQKENALNQIRILASLQCYSIIAYKEAFLDEKLGLLCVVMEFANQGDLQKFICQHKKQKKIINEKIIWRMIADIVVGLHELHQKGILHRDLKSANIFISSSIQNQTISAYSNQIYKLGDLNVSKVNHGEYVYTQTGTPYYASPQVWRDEPYDDKSDIWSFGCILYQIACLSPPFQGRDMEQLFRNVQNKQHQPIPENYSYQLADLIDQCLDKKARNRPNAKKLLEHSIIKRFIDFRKGKIEVNQFENFQNKKVLQFGKELQKQHRKLLETIKLPEDLKFLKDKLPISKYGSEKKLNQYQNYNSPRVKQRENIIKNRSSLADNKNEKQKFERLNQSLIVKNVGNSKRNDHSMQTGIKSQNSNRSKKMERPIKNNEDSLEEKVKISQSEVFLSPKSIVKPQNNQEFKYKSPQNRSKQPNKLQMLYSDRKQQPYNYSIDVQPYKNKSEKKPTQRISQKYTKFLNQQITKKKYCSISRTQKYKNINYSSHANYLPEKYKHLPNPGDNHMLKLHKSRGDQKSIEEWKQKLVKKARVYSNNNKHYYPIPY